jgi:hypothetical protein
MTIPLQSKKLQSCQSGKLNAETAGLKSEHIQKANGLEKKTRHVEEWLESGKTVKASKEKEGCAVQPKTTHGFLLTDCMF